MRMRMQTLEPDLVIPAEEIMKFIHNLLKITVLTSVFLMLLVSCSNDSDEASETASQSCSMSQD